MITSGIRKLRIKVGIESSILAAEQLNISYSMLNKIERADRSPSANLIVKMSKLYRCSIDDIYVALKKTS